ncbi:MAG TPA: hypothetical protein VGB44_05865 [Flavobacterium sp.]|jgi:hypothetical protein
MIWLLKEKKGQLVDVSEYQGEIDIPFESKEEHFQNDDLFIDVIIDVPTYLLSGWNEKEPIVASHIITNFDRSAVDQLVHWRYGNAQFYVITDLMF